MFKKLLIVSLMCGFGLSVGAKDISTAIKNIEVNDKLLDFVVDRCIAREEINEKDISNLKISSELKAELNLSLNLINEAISYIDIKDAWADRKSYCNRNDLKQILQEDKFIIKQLQKNYKNR